MAGQSVAEQSRAEQSHTVHTRRNGPHTYSAGAAPCLLVCRASTAVNCIQSHFLADVHVRSSRYIDYLHGICLSTASSREGSLSQWSQALPEPTASSTRMRTFAHPSSSHLGISFVCLDRASISSKRALHHKIRWRLPLVGIACRKGCVQILKQSPSATAHTERP